MFDGRSAVAAASSIGASSRVSVNRPATLTLITRSQAFQGKRSNGSPQFTPALLTRMCSTLVRRRPSSASAATPASLATVPPKPWQGPIAESSAATCSQTSTLREAISTRAPAGAAGNERGAAGDGKELGEGEHVRVLSGKWVRTGDPRPVAHLRQSG